MGIYRKRKAKPPIDLGTGDENVFLIQKQIEAGRGRGLPAVGIQSIQPTGYESVGYAPVYAPLDHQHPNRLIFTSEGAGVVENELRFSADRRLYYWSGTLWEPVKVDWSDIENIPSTQSIAVRKNSDGEGYIRPRLNFIEGSNITIDVVDDDTDGEVDITISATGGGGGGGGNAYAVVSDGTNTASASGEETLRFSSPDSSINIQVVAGNPDEVRLTVGSHTHPLSNLQQSGATTGQRPQWNGTQWVPSTVDWSEIANKPTAFPPSAHSHPLSDLEQSGASNNQVPKWNGSQWVASNVEWSEIANKPSAFPPSAHTHLLADIQQSGATIGQVPKWDGSQWVASNVEWAEVANKPSSFPPSAHSHPLSDLEQSGATANQVPKWNGTNWVPSNVDWSEIANKPSSFPPSAHTHPLSDLQQSGAEKGQVPRWSGTEWVASFVDWFDIVSKPSQFPVGVRKNGGTTYIRPRLNFIEGSNITIGVVNDPSNNEVDITISATGAGGLTNAYTAVSDGTNTASASGQETLRFSSPDSSINIQVVAGSPDEVQLTIGSHSHSLSDLQQSSATTGQVPKWNGSQWIASNVEWAEIANKPTVFPPAVHTHPLSDIQQSGAQKGQRPQWTGSEWVPSDVEWDEILSKPSRFPVGVRKNTGATTFGRPRLNFIEGSNISITIADDITNDEVDITISATGGGGGGNAYSSVSDGTNTVSASGQETLRFSSPDSTVQVQVSAGSPDTVNLRATPVKTTSDYGEVGSNNGEIWYRSTDRALFFRVGGQRVYPVAALPSTSEVPSGTGAGNRILAFSTSDRRIFEMGGNSQTPLWANAVAWYSNSAPTTANAGSSLNGKLWFDYSTKRLFVYDGSGASWRKPVAIADEVVQEGNGVNPTTGLSAGRIFMTSQGLMYTIPSNITSPTSGYAQVPVGQGVIVPSSEMIRYTTNLLSVITSTNGAFGGWNSTVYGEFIQSDAGSSATNQFEIGVPCGVFYLHQNKTIRVWFELWVIQGANNIVVNPRLVLTKLTQSSPASYKWWGRYLGTTPSFEAVVAPNVVAKRYGWVATVNTSSDFTLVQDGTTQGTVALDAPAFYRVEFSLVRQRASETTPRSTVVYYAAYVQIYDDGWNKLHFIT